MLEKFKPKVTTHSPYAHHAQQALPVITHYMNSSLYYQKIFLNLETAGYYCLEVLCSESMWVFNTLLEGKVASHSKHLKVPHDLWWTMSPWFEGNPFPHLKHLWLNCCEHDVTQKIQCTLRLCAWRLDLVENASPHSKQSWQAGWRVFYLTWHSV